MPPAAAIQRLVRHHDLDAQAAENLLRYLADQAAATGVVPDDRTIVIERCRDELGDWRICVLSPFGGRIHAPWAMAVVERARAETGLDVETMWTDDGFVVRFPETEEPPDPRLLLPASEEVEALVVRQLGGTALFAAKFREAAAARCSCQRRPGGRSPLWQQRKRAADLLAVAARFGSFPMLLEAYRECLRDVFDMPALVETLRPDRTARDPRRRRSTRPMPSPFAAALLFGYVANYIYDGDAPLAERRAQALSIDQAQLRELLGEAELRELLDADALADVERQLQQLDATTIERATVDGVHDLLLRLGDLDARRDRGAQPRSTRRRALDGADASAARDRGRRSAGEARVIPVEYAGRYRDAPRRAAAGRAAGGAARAGAARRAGPRAALRAHARAVHDGGVRRALRASAARPPKRILKELAAAGRLLEGEFRPGGSGTRVVRPRRAADRSAAARSRSCASKSSRSNRRSSAACSRSWQGVVRPRAGPRRAARRDREPAGRAARRRRSSRPRSSPARIERLSARPISTR